MEFKQNYGVGNEVLEGDGFFISYNPNPGVGFSLFASDKGSDETALVKEDDPNNKYRILNGDYRKEYKKLVLCGFKACVDFYNKQCEKHGSTWSTNNHA